MSLTILCNVGSRPELLTA